MVTGAPGATLLPLGVLVITNKGCRICNGEGFDAHSEYSPVLSLARTRIVWVLQCSNPLRFFLPFR